MVGHITTQAAAVAEKWRDALKEEISERDNSELSKRAVRHTKAQQQVAPVEEAR